MIALDRDVPATAAPAAADASTTFAELRPAYCLLGAPLAGSHRRCRPGDRRLPTGRRRWRSSGRFSSSCGLQRASSSDCVAGANDSHRSSSAERSSGRSARSPRRCSPIGPSTGPPSWPGTSPCASLPRCFRRSPCTCCSALVDGRLATPIRRNTVLAGYAIGRLIGVGLLANREHLLVWPLVVFWLAALGIGLYAAHARYVQGRGRGPAPHAVDRLGHGGRRRGRRRRRRPPAAHRLARRSPAPSPSPSPGSSPSASPAGRCRGWSPGSIACSPTPSPSPG